MIGFFVVLTLPPLRPAPGNQGIPGKHIWRKSLSIMTKVTFAHRGFDVTAPA
jgi:hypothetical protein